MRIVMSLLTLCTCLLAWSTSAHADFNAEVQKITYTGDAMVGGTVHFNVKVKNLSTPDSGYGGAATFCIWCEIDPPGWWNTFEQEKAGEAFALYEIKTVAMPSFVLDDDGEWAVTCEVRSFDCSADLDSLSGTLDVQNCQDECSKGDTWCSGGEEVTECVEDDLGCYVWQTSNCAYKYKCSGGECVAKSCPELDFPLGECGGVDDDGVCKEGDTQVWWCVDAGPLNCWLKMDGCAGDETCIDPWTSEAFCVFPGHEDYCNSMAAIGKPCGHGLSDCDLDSQCAGDLTCEGPMWPFGGMDGCCWADEAWDGENCIANDCDALGYPLGECDWVNTAGTCQESFSEVWECVDAGDKNCWEAQEACSGTGVCYVSDLTGKAECAYDGDGVFCEAWKEAGAGCLHGESDCDFDNQCLGDLVCIGPMWPFGGQDGCCYEDEDWDGEQCIGGVEPPSCPGDCLSMGEFLDEFDYPFVGQISDNGIWAKQSHDWVCELDETMVTTQDGMAVLHVSGGGAKCSQIDGGGDGLFFGSYRASIKTSPNSGLCGAMFFYGPDGESEIDVEILSKESDLHRVHFVTHPSGNGDCGTPAHQCVDMATDPSQGFHVYGFDLYPDRVEFFIDDVKVAEITVNIPQNPGTLILSNWTGNEWTGAPPGADSAMYVEWAEYVPSGECTLCPQCGNEMVNLSEECDGAYLGGATCQSLGLPAGELLCAGDCDLDVSGCEVPPGCGDGACADDEKCWSCPADCGDCPVGCGDGKCAVDEDCAMCPEDCGECPKCGDGKCDPGESCMKCAEDCGECENCGNGECDPGENCANCPDDCGECCGNGDCQPAYGEDCEACPGDCGACPVDCGNGKCDVGESCETCTQDCGECCGNGKCEAGFGEDCNFCPEDCGECDCEPDCTGKSCGSDGCGGLCSPGCGPDEECNQGQCEEPVVVPVEHDEQVEPSDDVVTQDVATSPETVGEQDTLSGGDNSTFVIAQGDEDQGSGDKSGGCSAAGGGTSALWLLLGLLVLLSIARSRRSVPLLLSAVLLLLPASCGSDSNGNNDVADTWLVDSTDGDGAPLVADLAGGALDGQDGGPADEDVGLVPPGTVRFIHASDPHYQGTPDSPHSNELTKMADQLNDLDFEADLLFMTGDLVHFMPDEYHGQEGENNFTAFASQLYALSIPWFPAIGNHDYYDSMDPVITTLDKAAREALWEKSLGRPPYYAEDVNGIRLLSLNTMDGESWDSNDGVIGSYSTEQLDWLADQLSQGRPSIIFQHHPPGTTAPVGEQQALCDLISANPGVVKGIFTGHLHEFMEGQYCGVPTYIVESVSLGHTYYYLVEYEGPTDTLTVVNLEDIPFADLPQFECDPGAPALQTPDKVGGLFQKLKPDQMTADAPELGQYVGEVFEALPLVLYFDAFDSDEGRFEARLALASRWGEVEGYLSYLEGMPCFDFDFELSNSCFSAGPVNFSFNLLILLPLVTEEPEDLDYELQVEIENFWLEGAMADDENGVPVISEGILHGRLKGGKMILDIKEIFAEQYCKGNIENCQPGSSEEMPECPDDSPGIKFFPKIPESCDVMVAGYSIRMILMMADGFGITDMDVIGSISSHVLETSVDPVSGRVDPSLFSTEEGKNCAP